jgi:PIN domain nuclease of toxin-antitoxin system
VKALLDTRLLLWWLADDPSLPALAADAISNPDVDVIVSSATAWEMAIKKAAGRLEAPDDLLGALQANGFASLSITVAHAIAAGRLPEHHSDPFDRMLIAQARIEGLTLITVDRRFPEYDVDLLPLA